MKLLALSVTAAGIFLGGALVPAAAQQTVRVMATSDGDFGLSSSRIGTRSVEQYAAILKLTDDQKQMAMSLREGYDAAVSAAASELRASIEEMSKAYQDSQDSSVWTERMPKARKAYRDKTRELEKGFFDDLKSLLTGDQESRYPGVERLRRRETVLRSGMQSGESVDLISIVDGLRLPPPARAALDQPLADYEQDLDRALLAKAKDLGQGPSFEPGKPWSPEDMKAQMAKAREAGQKIKDVNQRFARLLESEIPEDRRAEFARAVREATYPRVYHTSRTSKLLDAAAGLPDLQGIQRQEIQTLKESYQHDLGPVNEKWAAGIEEQERTGADGAMQVPGMGTMRVAFSDDENNPAAKAHKVRRELDEKTAEKLNSILNKDQKERVEKTAAPAEDAETGFGGGQVIIRQRQD